MKIKDGAKRINYGKTKSIIDIEFGNKYQLHVFQGKISDYDIIVRYTEKGKRIRTPKHIHWAVDILIKMQGNESLTKKFLCEIKKLWDDSKPLNNNDMNTLKKLIIANKNRVNLNCFDELSKYGEYGIEFLFTLMQLLVIQEKTNRNDAYMFGNIINKLLEDEIDIYSIMSTAGFGGK